MDYGLLIRALEKHAKISASAVTFYREHHKGVAYQQAMVVMQEAVQALEHVKKMQALAHMQRDLYRAGYAISGEKCTEEKTETEHRQNLETKINGSGENS